MAIKHWQDIHDFITAVILYKIFLLGWEASGYGRTFGDRKFAFKCCLTEEKLRNEYKTGYLNGFRENFEYKVKNGQYITGIYSYHDNGKE